MDFLEHSRLTASAEGVQGGHSPFSELGHVAFLGVRGPLDLVHQV